MATVVIAEDHPIVRKGIRAFLTQTTEHEIVAECGDGIAALELVKEHRPDVLITDLRMPGLDGLEVTRRVHQDYPNTAVVVLSAYSSDSYVSRAFRNGALAYLLKDSDIMELNDAITSALSGKRFISKSLASRTQREPTLTDRYELLTARQREVLHLIGEGLTTPEISEKLSISGRTVEKHRSNLMQKLEVKNYADLIRFALQRGLSPLD
ncbi:MAG: response regulator transcription factor [Bacteroidetes bacterium]|nr:response regulator transcription factor [Bacteroidota bacterium]MCH8246639.1 response regulator transcription factor [Bacteroidota bacterium]